MAESHKRLQLSPSSAKRWSTCTASPRYIVAEADRLPEDKGSTYADEGSQAHKWAEEALILGSVDFLDTKLDAEEHELLKGYVERTLAYVEQGYVLEVESKSPLPYQPERNAIMDSLLYKLDGDTVEHLIVRDLKWGSGQMVEVQDNEQLIIYGGTALDQLEVLFNVPNCARVTLEIDQPRGDGLGTWELTVGELREKFSELAQIAYAIQDGESPVEFVPSEEACRWCPAKGICGARLGSEAPTLLPLVVPALTDIGVSLTTEQISTLVKNAKLIRKVLDDAEELIRSSIDSFPDWKLVAGKGGHRKWIDEDEAKKFLARHFGMANATVVKPISPAQADKLIKGMEEAPSKRWWTSYNSLFAKGEGNPTLAPSDDPRPSISNTNTESAEQAFSDV